MKRARVKKSGLIWLAVFVIWAYVIVGEGFKPSLAPQGPVAVHRPKKNEAYYAGKWSALHRGDTEYYLPDRTRVDVVTADYAVEVDFAEKWYQAIGQSLHYALHTKKDPGIVLISRKDKDAKYVNRLVAVIQEYGLPITVWQMTEDAESVIYDPVEKRISKK